MEQKRPDWDTTEKLILLLRMISVLLIIIIIASEIFSHAQHQNDLLEEEHTLTALHDQKEVNTNYSQIPSAQTNELQSLKIPQGSSLHRRNRTVHIGKVETLLILRSYLAHATNWKDVLEDVKQNISQLPEAANKLYQTAANEKQRRDRMSRKLEKLINQKAENIDDLDGRSAVQDIKIMERILVKRMPSQPKEQDGDMRGAVAAGTQSKIENKTPKQNQNRHQKKKTSIIDLIRQNLLGPN
ncbi:uncharacterized protein LOC123554539 [Mercenaria mercenaria]|uniref:uncharacterized protein LOC123554539 n=1 Tax=Mercenaria mercenaria TaxID=6596 RepID=UPI00234E3F10|nr:uncharacterized protein LOC123554539 [Mercenaria mercenaria]XP_045200698.2 uncharacterized protein LOC123554539 [Mercenaria mercenaria]